MNYACLECAQRAGTPESATGSSLYGGSGYQCGKCRTQWRRSAWGHWQSGPQEERPATREASPYWPYA